MAKNGFTVPYGLSAQAQFITQADGAEAVVEYLAALEKYYEDGEQPEGLSTSAAIVFGLARPTLDDCRERSASGKKGVQAKRKLNEANDKLIEANDKLIEAISTKETERKEEEKEKDFPPTPPLEREKEEVKKDKEKYIYNGQSADEITEAEAVTDTTITTPANKTLDEEFNELWLLYPRKVGKKDALRHYKTARKEGATFDTVSSGLFKYIEYCRGQPDKYIMHGSTWFCGHHWEDEHKRQKGALESIMDL